MARPISFTKICEWVMSGKIKAYTLESSGYKRIETRGNIIYNTLYSLGAVVEEAIKNDSHSLTIGYTRGNNSDNDERIADLDRKCGFDICIASDIEPNTSEYDFLMKCVKLHQIKAIVIQADMDIGIGIYPSNYIKKTLIRYNTHLKVLYPPQ